VAFSKLEKVLLAKLGVDVVRQPITRKVAIKIAMAAARIVAPATVPIASALSPYAPIAAGAALGGYALQTELGQEVVGLRPDLTYDPGSLVAERGRQDRLRFERYVQDTLALAPIKRKRRMSKFNAAVKKGMSIVKQSTSYGRKGIINNPKKAFAAVTKTVSKANKRQKAPKKGILKKVFTAAAKLVQVGSFAPGKLPKRKKSRSSRGYEGNIGR